MPLLYQYKERHETNCTCHFWISHWSIILIGLHIIFKHSIRSAQHATATPSVTPTISSSPTPAPTYTPIPSVRIENADQAFFDGDIESAMADYRAAYADSSDPTIKAAALWGLARAQYTDGRNADVLATLQQLNSSYPDSPFAKGPSYFLQGQTYSQMKNYANAAQAYQMYLNAASRRDRFVCSGIARRRAQRGQRLFRCARCL